MDDPQSARARALAKTALIYRISGSSVQESELVEPRICFGGVFWLATLFDRVALVGRATYFGSSTVACPLIVIGIIQIAGSASIVMSTPGE